MKKLILIGVLAMIIVLGCIQSQSSPTIPRAPVQVTVPITIPTPSPNPPATNPTPPLTAPLTPNTVEFPATCIEGKCVHVQLATTEAEKQRGLMGVASLSDAEGMLFVWEEEGQHPFWMKDTLIPLDMIWIDAQSKVVDITTMQPCAADPCTVYSPIANAQYVLETRAGLMEAWDVTRGSEAQLLIPTVN